MSAHETQFDGIADTFAEHADTVRGYIRYELTHANLGSVFTDRTWDVVDIGGGSGIDAVWLASEGHRVTLVEPSSEQREKAEQRKQAMPDNDRAFVTIRPGTVSDLLAEGHANSFDLVLSHGVAMYIPEHQLFIASLVKLAKPGGYVSVLEKGFIGHLERMRRQKKSATEIAHFQETKIVKTNNMGRSVRAFHPEELEEILVASGANITTWSGVRVEADKDERMTHQLRPEELAALKVSEVGLGGNHATRSRGQMLHFIAQKHQ